MAICRPQFIILLLVIGTSKSELSSQTIHGECEELSLFQQKVQVHREVDVGSQPKQVNQLASAARTSGTKNNTIADEDQARDDIINLLQESNGIRKRAKES
mmetsp:Transcript_157615/g.278179  ORF Transcript_157615/g.278179 Transcript_157615/m.278179 type:complete len:101 (+) Transcript_157615:66-368(+)